VVKLCLVPVLPPELLLPEAREAYGGGENIRGLSMGMNDDKGRVLCM